MWLGFRNKLIALGYTTWRRGVRVRSRLKTLGRRQLGALDHVTIAVHDLAAARRFYCDVLGGTYLMTVDDETFKRFGRPPAPNGGEGSHHTSVYFGGTTRVDLFLQRSGQPPTTAGHPHYAFRVPARHLLKWRAHLQAHGVPTDGPVQLGPPGQASVYFNDPFGNHLELHCMGFPTPIPVRPPAVADLIWKRQVL